MNKRKNMRKIYECCAIFIIITSVLLTSNIDCNATSGYKFIEIEEYSDAEFNKMTVEELNNYINQIAQNNQKSEFMDNISMNINKVSSNSCDPVANAWKAAAVIARKKGYPCAAKLVECSVDNVSYKESSIMAQGLFAKKIVKTSAYKTFMSKAKSKDKAYSSSFAITKSMNSDLYYALHNVNIKESHTGAGNYKVYNLKVTDTFDFACDNKYDSLFDSCVNNWAWLCQQTGALHKVKVEIDFTE